MDEIDGMTPLTIPELWKRDPANHIEGISGGKGSRGL